MTAFKAAEHQSGKKHNTCRRPASRTLKEEKAAIHCSRNTSPLKTEDPNKDLCNDLEVQEKSATKTINVVKQV